MSMHFRKLSNYDWKFIEDRSEKILMDGNAIYDGYEVDFV
jgi:hypothetical protein